MKISLLILGNPAEQDSAVRALQAARAIIERGDQLALVFFYSEAVQIARESAFPALSAEWVTLAPAIKAPLVVCSSSALRRDILDDREAEALGQSPTLVSGFQLAGLGQLAEAIATSDRLAIIGRTSPDDGSGGEAITEQPTTGTPLVIIEREGTNAHVTRESLDLAMALAAFLPGTALLFRDQAVSLLLTDPDRNPHHKAVKALQEYGLEDCFAPGEDLRALGLSVDRLCIPCRIVDDAGYRNLLDQHSPVITL